MTHLAQGALPAHQATLVHHARPDAGGDGDVGHVVVSGPGPERGLSHGGEVGVVRHVHRYVEAGRQGVLREKLGPAFGQVRRPQEAALRVVDRAGKADHGVARGTGGAIAADAAQQVEQCDRDRVVVRGRSRVALEYLATGVHQRGAHRRSADVGGQDVAGPHHDEMA